MKWAAFKRGAVAPVVATGAVPAARACGYHDPSSVKLGMLNRSHPDALHVGTAVWMAQRDDTIARTEPLDPDGPLPARLRQALRLRETVTCRQRAPCRARRTARGRRGPVPRTL